MLYIPHIISSTGGAAGAWYPAPTNGAGTGVYNAAAGAAGSIFAGNKMSALILSVNVDRDQFAIGNGINLRWKSGGNIITRLTPSANAFSALREPFYVPGGFNVFALSAAGVWSVCYVLVPNEGE